MDRTTSTRSRAAAKTFGGLATKHTLLRTVQFGFVLTAMYASLAAAGTDDTRVDLELTSSDHPTYTAGGGAPFSLTAKKLSSVRSKSGANAEFWVLDYNPLLYTYSASSKESQTDEAKAIQQFADAVAKFGGGLQTQKLSAQAAQLHSFIAGQAHLEGANVVVSCPVLINGIDVAKLEQLLTSLNDEVKSDIPTKVLDLANAPATSKSDQALTLRGLAQSDLIELRRKFGPKGEADLAEISKELKKLQDLDAMPATPDRYVLQRCDTSDSQSAASLQTLAAALIAKAQRDRDNKAEYDKAASGADDAARLQRQTDPISKTIVLVNKFLATLGTVGNPYPLTDENLPVDQYGDVTITVKSNTEFSPLTDSSKSLASQRSRSYVIRVEPEQYWHPSISAAAIYSFVKNPTYSVQSNSSNQLVIGQTSNDYNKVSGAVMLNLTPDPWNQGLVKPHLQMGIVPDSDKLALLLGSGISATTLVELDFGAIYQKATSLATGQSVGQIVQSTSALKTQTNYKVGFYVAIGVKLK